MVYVRNVLTRTMYLMVIFTLVVLLCESAEAGTTKFAYKKPIFGKANIFKEKRLRAAKAETAKTHFTTAKTATTTTTTTTTTTPAPTTTSTTTTTTSTTTAASTSLPQPVAALPTDSGSNESDRSVIVQSVHAGHNEQQGEQPQDVLQITVETKSSNNNENSNQQTPEIESDKSTVAALAENQSPSITEVELVKASDEHDEEFVDTTLEVSVEMDEPPQILGLPSNSEMINIAIETVPAKQMMPLKTTTIEIQPQTESNLPVPCTCGIFMTSQIKRGVPQSRPVILNELDRPFVCNPIGQKQCQTKCLETIVQHLPNSASILCATLDRDCRKERAYLFIKNCRNFWINTHLAAGREYCCKNGQPYQCPLM